MSGRLSVVLCLLIYCQNSLGNIRKVKFTEDQIVAVRTALGIATIIQVPDTPNSLVVGDQGAFKVEYLDQGITIKPLRRGAKSNLYIYTDYRRFNVQLISVHESKVDYVVYLENPREKPKGSALLWVNFKNHLKNGKIKLVTNRFAKTSDGILLIEFEIFSKIKEEFRPEWIWLTQNGQSKPIHRLVLSGQVLGGRTSVKGLLQITRSDILDQMPMRIELRRERTSYLTIPKVVEWK